MTEPSALSLLQHDEICEVLTKSATDFREARWRPHSKLFFFIDGDRPTYCTLDEVQEWKPAGVEF